MTTISLVEAQEQLTAWLAASKAVAKGQSYSKDGRSLSRVDAAEIRTNINYFSRIVADLTNQANGGPSHGHARANFL